MLNKLISLNYNHCQSPLQQTPPSFGRDLTDEVKNNGQEPERIYPSKYDGWELYVREINKVPNLSKQREESLGKVINKVRKTEELIEVLTKRAELDETIEKGVKVKNLLNKTLPDKAEKIINMINDHQTNNEIYSFVFQNEAAGAYIKREDVISDPIVKEIIKNTKTFNPRNVFRVLLTSIKTGNDAQKMIARVQKDINDGLYKPEELEIVKNGGIPPRFQMWKEMSKKAQNKLVESNLKNIPQIIKSCKGILPAQDAAQAAAIGIIDSAEKFDYTQGYSFKNYSWRNAKNAVRDEIKENGHLIKLQSDFNSKNKQISNFFFPDRPQPATTEEIHEHLGFSPKIQENIKKQALISKPLSLSSFIPNSAGVPYEDVIPANNGDCFDTINQKRYKISLKNVLKSAGLSSRDKLIVATFLINKNASLKELGEKLDISSERVRKIRDEFPLDMNEIVIEYKRCDKVPQERKEQAKKAIQELKPEERMALKHKYGFYDTYGKPITDKELAETLGMTEDVVRTKYTNALKKLKKAGFSYTEVLSTRNLPELKKIVMLWNTIKDIEDSEKRARSYKSQII